MRRDPINIKTVPQDAMIMVKLWSNVHGNRIRSTDFKTFPSRVIPVFQRLLGQTLLPQPLHGFVQNNLSTCQKIKFDGFR